MKLQRLLTKVHMYAGLQAGLGLLIFAASVFAVMFSPPLEWKVSSAQFDGTLDEDPLVAARELHEQIGLRFEMSPQRWMVSEENEILKVRLQSPNGRRDVSIDRTSGAMELRTARRDTLSFLNIVHQKSFGSRVRGDSLWLWAWAAYIEATLLALFFLPISGFYIWLVKRRQDRLAVISLFCSTATMSLLWILVR